MGHHGRVKKGAMTERPGATERRAAVRGSSGSVGPELIELARDAAEEESGSAALVGEFAGLDVEDEVAVTLRFHTRDVAYAGWFWSVTLAVVDPDRPTISEVVLLPGSDALLPPGWLPWRERVRPDDLGPGDLLPLVPDDPRVVPSYVQSDDPAVEELARELGFGRPRVLSRLGRIEAAERWNTGEFGPESEMAKAAPAPCSLCAFYLPVAGSLGSNFGACSNSMSPADGRVVDALFGCGAHSEVAIDLRTQLAESHIDDLVLDVYSRPRATPAVDASLAASLHQAAELIEEEVDTMAQADRVASERSAFHEGQAGPESQQPE
jgi:hypothetical protein